MDANTPTQQNNTTTQINLNEYLQKESTPFLKPSDIPGRSGKLKIIGVREAVLKFSGKSILLDVIVKKQNRTFIINKTNLKRLVSLFGSDVSNWLNQDITVVKVLVTNPKTKQEQESLRIK
jgi:hypothetical protein